VQPEVKGIKIGGKINSTSLHFCVMIARKTMRDRRLAKTC
jgi:hypothetical protein